MAGSNQNTSGEKPEQKQQQQQQDRGQDYLRVLSHQLKTPINAIQSLLRTVTDGYTGETNAQTRQVIEKAVGRAAEARELITDLLDYQLYSQQQKAAAEEYDIVPLLNELVKNYSEAASEKDVSLHADLPLRNSVILTGDSRGMNQAMRNLIENAVKYTPERGSVTVRLKLADEDRQCRLRISDTGYGIPEDELESIFEPFYRSIKHKSNITGTGLGLPIAKKIVENHGGTISVTSQENSGTAFDIVLPVTDVKKSDEPAVERKQVLIIGGVTAGPKVAARLRRLDEDLDITIIERSDFLSYSGCGLPAYINGKVRTAKELMSTADATVRDIDYFESIKNISILNDTLALSIDRNKKQVSIKDLTNDSISDLPYDYLVLATGTRPLVPEIPGIDEENIYSLYSLEDAEAIKKAFSKGNAQDVYIIGGGLIGVSIAESLIETGKRVTILEKKQYILIQLMDRDIAERIERVLTGKGIKIVTGVNIERIQQGNKSLAIITGEGSYQADIIIVSTGVKPNVALAEQAGLTIGPSGGIQVDKHLLTSDESIYAIGDCAESMNLITERPEYWPLGSISTKMGRIVADNIAGNKAEFHGSLGTALFKVVDVNVARTGLTERDAWKAGIETETAVVTGFDRAHYYGQAEIVVVKIVAEKESRRIIGAQMYGKGEVSGRIGIIAGSIMQGLSLEAFFTQDLGYYPAFNSPIDIVQTAALVLKNKMDKLVRMIGADDFNRGRDEIDGIISVCPLSAYQNFMIPDSINVPLENLRFSQIPFDKKDKIVLYSRTSSGAYMAYRYLVSKGYTNLFVLEGGFEFWNR